MKRLACILLLAFPLISLSVAAQELPKPPAISKPLVVEPVKSKTAGHEKSGLLRRGLTVRQAWALGITPRNVMKSYKSLESDGTITDESSEFELASAIGNTIRANNKSAFEEFQGPIDSADADAALDPKWMAILEAIINILKMLGIL